MTNKPTSNIIKLKERKNKKEENICPHAGQAHTFFYEKESYAKKPGKVINIFNNLLHGY